MKHYKAVPFSDSRYALAESPFSDSRTGIISYVDITPGRFYRLFPNGETRCLELGQPVGAAVPAAEPGAYVLAAADGLYYFTDGSVKRIADLTGRYRPWQRSNDAKADPAGRLFFGSSSMDGAFGDNGDLYRLDPASGIRVVQENTKISNGMAWDRAAQRFFFSDSLEYAVFVYDYDLATGDITNRRVLFPVSDGVPDGMCIDANDDLWLAVWGGRRLEKRSSGTGELLAVVDVDAEHVSSCCFIDENTLLITSSGDGLSGAHDGKLFTCRVDAPAGETHYCGASAREVSL